MPMRTRQPPMRAGKSRNELFRHGWLSIGAGLVKVLVHFLGVYTNSSATPRPVINSGIGS